VPTAYLVLKRPERAISTGWTATKICAALSWQLHRGI
jgi:hypothetical protein